MAINGACLNVFLNNEVYSAKYRSFSLKAACRYQNSSPVTLYIFINMANFFHFQKSPPTIIENLIYSHLAIFLLHLRSFVIIFLVFIIAF